MIQIKDNYQLLIEKLDDFIRKYYVNQLIRGGLYTIGLMLTLFTVFNILEYYFYFPTGVRKALFWSGMGASALALYGWVAVPLMHYFRLGKVISHEKASTIIGQHFTDVKDKLLNILQLRQQSMNSAQAELVLASINQKSEEIKFVPFKSAIDLSKNKKNLRYALPPLLLLLLILFFNGSIIKEGTKRLLQNNQEFEKPAPFKFIVNKDSLTALQFSDYILKVKVEGDVIPNEVFIDVDNYQYRLQKEEGNSGLYSYKFSNIQKETDFKLFSGSVRSGEYKIDVLKKPNILGFDVKLDYPAYIGRPDEDLSNVGDLVVPLGTNIAWLFKSQNTDNIAIKFSQKGTLEAKKIGNESFSFQKMAVSDESYKIYVSNSNVKNADSVAYTITVMPDAYPTINVEKFVDSTNNKVLFFAGDASDDYGLRSLNFNYRVKKAGEKSEGELKTIPMTHPVGKQMQYKHVFNVTELGLKPGDEASYYFEVFDNDAINGSKSARTNLMTFSVPSVSEYQKMAAKNNDEIKKDLEKAIKETKKIQDELKQLREKLLQKKEPDWQDKKQLENLLNKQKDVDKQIDQAKDNFDENRKNQEEYSKPDEKLLQKQEQVEKLFEQLKNDEMKKLMEEMEKMMEKMEKDQTLDNMEKMQMSNEELNMELDRMMELFKKLELEQKMDEHINKLEELAKEEDKLGDKTEKEEKSKDELKKEQEELNKKFDELKEEQKELDKMNEKLEHKKELGTDEKDMDDIKNDMKESKDDINSGDNKKAAKKQKKAASKMKNAANKMKGKMASGDSDQLEEDLAMIRQLLENLVGISYDQEDVLKLTGSTSINTPKFVELVQKQHKIKDDFRIVEDSLVALSKRQEKIESFVTEKVADVKQNMRKGLDELEERHIPQATDLEQRTMKAVNDLALMLSESMAQMQKEMAGMMPGDQQCDNPGGKGKGKKGKGGKDGKEPSDKIGEGQKELNEQLKQMRDKMKNGKGAAGGNQPGSKEFAQMAAKQSSLRKALRELSQEKKQRGEGKGSEQLDKIANDMDKVETDLVNKRLSNETVKRLEEIETRLLESDKAEREREYDEKRKGQAAKSYEPATPPSMQEYLKKREAEIELYRTVSPSLKPYYKFLVEEYMKTLKK